MLREIFGSTKCGMEVVIRPTQNKVRVTYMLMLVLFSSRRIKWAGNVKHTRKMKNSYKILIVKRESKSPLGMPRHRREDSIKTILKR